MVFDQPTVHAWYQEYIPVYTLDGTMYIVDIRPRAMGLYYETL